MRAAAFCDDGSELTGPAAVAWHDEALAERWDAVVQDGDTVWVLGDISGGSRNRQFNALEWIRQRPGAKHLIGGNHDGCHPMHRDSHRWQPIYLQSFDSVQMAARRRIPCGGSHVTALLSHFPFGADHVIPPRYMEWRLPPEGHRYYLLHGHTHSANRFNGREIHVGVDAWDLAPVAVGDIQKYVEQRESGLTHVPPSPGETF